MGAPDVTRTKSYALARRFSEPHQRRASLGGRSSPTAGTDFGTRAQKRAQLPVNRVVPCSSSRETLGSGRKEYVTLGGHGQRTSGTTGRTQNRPSREAGPARALLCSGNEGGHRAAYPGQTLFARHQQSAAEDLAPLGIQPITARSGATPARHGRAGNDHSFPGCARSQRGWTRQRAPASTHNTRTQGCHAPVYNILLHTDDGQGRYPTRTGQRGKLEAIPSFRLRSGGRLRRGHVAAPDWSKQQVRLRPLEAACLRYLRPVSLPSPLLPFTSYPASATRRRGKSLWPGYLPEPESASRWKEPRVPQEGG